MTCGHRSSSSISRTHKRSATGQLRGQRAVRTARPTTPGQTLPDARRGGLSVTEVCFAVGCASLGTFTTRFTELVGMPSGAFRRQAADAAADHADAAATARDGGSAIKVEGMPACVAKQVSRPVRNREAPAAALPLA
ncbi:AraC family transcriptional regulator [Embleya sp. NBC_00896]|uniref:AraC family transcriptional regulator n=1 Tax=Embleya sp. NBC_00896 TaxID=2975961 RepID=UPI00386942EE